MKMLSGLVCVYLLAFSQTSIAGINNPGSAGGGVTPSTSQSGIVGFDGSMFPFVNFMKMAFGSISNSNTTFIYPNNLNTSNLPTGTLPAQLLYGTSLPSNYFGQYVIAATGTVTGTGLQGIQIGDGNFWGQVYAKNAGATLNGCSNGNVPPCYFENNLEVTGTNLSVTLDFSAPITGAVNNGSGLVRLSIVNTTITNGLAVTVSGVVGSDGNGCGANGAFTTANRTSTTVDLTGSTFNGSCTYSSGGQLFQYQQTGGFSNANFTFNSGTAFSNMTALIMCKLADYNADNTCGTTAGKTSWAGGFNDDFVASVAALRPRFIRFLDVNKTVLRNGADYNGFPTTSAWSYNLQDTYFAMTNWFGSTSGTNTYTASCASPCTYALSSGVPKDGDLFHFYNVNANTNMTPTLAVTDINSVTSSAIPILPQTANQIEVTIGGTITTGDTIALHFATTPVSAGTCLAGSAHTTTAYTVLNTDTIATIQAALVSIAQGDATLTAQNSNIETYNPSPGSGTFYFGYASQACSLAVTSVITGSATETVTTGTMTVGQIAANTIYTAIYNARLKAFLISNNIHGGIANAWPYIIQIDLANAVSTKSGKATACWLQMSLLWSNASAQSLFNLENANQCAGGVIYEIGNEIWNYQNQNTGQADFIGNALGFGFSNHIEYEMLRSRELFSLAETTYGSIGTHFYPWAGFQLGAPTNSFVQGSGLCGTSCGNQAYQNAIGSDYNSSPNQPAQFIYAIGEAPYYMGSILNNAYFSSGTYSSWSATNSSVSGNVLSVSGTITNGPIFPNQGISSCDGVYIYTPTTTNFASGQLSGTVSTTLNGAITRNQSTAITLTSTAGLSVGMWAYDVTTGLLEGGSISSINSGANQIAITHPSGVFPSHGTNDTIVFGGLAGTYQLNSTTCSASSGTITGGDVLGLQYAADNYNSVNGAIGSQQDALNWVYQDAYASTLAGAMFSTTTVRSNVDPYNVMDAVAVTNSFKAIDYEGGFQSLAPTTGQATTMGLPSSAYGGSTGYIKTLLTAFKNNTLMNTLETARHNNELALLPSGSMTSWYVFSSNGQWALFPNNLYFPAPYKSYNAICNYNGGSC